MSPIDKLHVTLMFPLFLALSACAAVSSQSQEDARDPSRISNREEVVEDIWRLNEQVVLEMAMWIEGDTDTDFSLQDFAEAIEFFEGTTGIVSHTGTIFGRVPNERTRATMAKWNAWFEENKDTLVLTPSSCISKAPVTADSEEAQETEQR